MTNISNEINKITKQDQKIREIDQKIKDSIKEFNGFKKTGDLGKLFGTREDLRDAINLIEKNLIANTWYTNNKVVK